MRRLHTISAAVFALIALATLGLWQSHAANPAPAPAPATVWEYTSFQHSVYTSHGLDKAMNDLGAKGWEFCGAHQATVTQDDVPRPVTVYVFKRAKPQAK
jgi:hypothetical protein